jgi:hypothetical protein
LLSYAQLARRGKPYQPLEPGTRMIPLNEIVGSVGRYRDFNKEFLPRSNINQERWTRVDQVMHSLEGWPPIEVYKIGEVYFVRDGNHRISVARANGLTHLEAYVTEVQTDVPLTLDDFERDAWLIKTERAEFENATHLDEIRPGNNVVLTEPGRYKILLRHIFVHHYLRNQDLDREGDPRRLTWEEAVASWYDNVYMPVAEVIRSQHILAHFPHRTEADLYLWITYHREELAKNYELAPLSPEMAVATFAEAYDERPLQRALKALRFSILKMLGSLGKPLGMSEEDYEEARARHDAGERTIMEAEAESAQSEEAEALAAAAE